MLLYLIVLMLLYLIVGMELKHIHKVEGSSNEANFIIRANTKSFFNRVFVLPIGNSSCSTTRVVSG